MEKELLSQGMQLLFICLFGMFLFLCGKNVDVSFIFTEKFPTFVEYGKLKIDLRWIMSMK